MTAATATLWQYKVVGGDIAYSCVKPIANFKH